MEVIGLTSTFDAESRQRVGSEGVYVMIATPPAACLGITD